MRRPPWLGDHRRVCGRGCVRLEGVSPVAKSRHGGCCAAQRFRAALKFDFRTRQLSFAKIKCGLVPGKKVPGIVGKVARIVMSGRGIRRKI